jgi:hypothetical protein
VASRTDFWKWFRSVVNEIHDDDKYSSAAYKPFVEHYQPGAAENSTGFVADFNKIFSAVFLVQTRRRVAECSQLPGNQIDAYRDFVPVCYTDTVDTQSYLPPALQSWNYSDSNSVQDA